MGRRWRPGEVTVMGVATKGHNPIVYGCGPKVARRAVAVLIDDGTDSASLDFTLYVVNQTDAWLVWDSY
jgi:hypothetical protein